VVFVSRERTVETERRLGGVMRAAHVVHLDGSWCFRRFRGRAPLRAVATVKDDAGWCALVPATDGAAAHYGLTRTTFPPTIDNSGFVGWLATTIKQRTGSGAFVICGDNPQRGGIFDYLGYPLEVADAVRGLIAELRLPEQRDSLDLHLRVFEVVETSHASAISCETVFEFRETNGVVESRYAGGGVVSGSLTGRREGDRVAAAYAQLDAGGELRTGTNTMRIQAREREVRLIEQYTWSDGAEGRNVLRSTNAG
jgi:hypothetical protein